MTSSASTAWALAEPSSVPPPPQSMSYSVLREVEECPRRWQLSRASYPTLWTKAGYPSPVNIAQIDGWAVHGTVEKVVKVLLQKGCRSSREPEAIAALRELGGFTRLLRESYEGVLAGLAENPRARPVIAQTRQSIASRIEGARVALQAMLSRVEVAGHGHSNQTESKGPGEREKPITSKGTYPEVSVTAPSVGWTGVIDLLTISEGACEIRDFKTGSRKDHHLLQVRIYALLWLRDANRNPSTLPATKLVLSYTDVDVPLDAPTPAELNALEKEIVGRAAAARRECAAPMATARPSAEVCRYCSVRQMCGEYWAQQVVVVAGGQPVLTDAQLAVAERYAPRSWGAALKQSDGSVARVLLRTRDDRSVFAPGQQLRLLNVFVSQEAAEGEGTPSGLVVTLSANSEIYALPAEQPLGGSTL